ncbi:hypothetical protein L3X38_011748 [Prunus dulcis]|uniref:Uncharacterized protein n=1 Tax=Prunus dulcis TaxID=3755 RepID=A0AAD4WKA1_PRUDU|nr:hypothetical protein L3X38_011748 [Prunus dulcis]
MGVFKLPVTLYAELNSMISKFWWKNSEYCKAGKGRASSYVWRSLTWGRELLFNWIRKRIVDGQDTLVYGDAWIPRPNSFCSFAPQVLDQETKVSAFIFPNGNWNVDLLNLCFRAEDVKAISSILLSVN